MITSDAVTQATQACAFGQIPLLTGETQDLILSAGQLHRPADAVAVDLRRVFDGILVAIYDIDRGLRAQRPGDEAELRRVYREALEAWPTDEAGRPPAPDGAGLVTFPPAEAAAAIALLARQAATPVAVVIDDADLLLYEPLTTDAGRLVVARLRDAFSRRNAPRQTRTANPIVLVAHDPGSIGGGLAQHPLVQHIPVTNPTLAEREHIVGALELPAELARRASGLSRRRLLCFQAIATVVDPARSPDRAVRVAVNGLPRRPWSAADRAHFRDHVAPAVRASLPGQEVVVDRACDRLSTMGMPRVRRQGPREAFLLAGSPGTGKTEFARLVSLHHYGDPTAIRRFDMSEYMEQHSRAKLIGAPPGYVGFEGGGQLTDWVLSHPDSIVLLDEIEKAHEDVLLLLLQILEDGRLTDGQGRTVDFGGIVLLMTTNLGSAEAISELTAGALDPEPEVLTERMAALIQRALSQPREAGGVGRPELWSRLKDALMVFDVVRRTSVPRIVERLLDDFVEAWDEAGYQVEIDAVALGALAARDRVFAATEGTWDTRDVLSWIKRSVALPLQLAMAEAPDGSRANVSVGTVGTVVVTVTPP
jgi:hypothetical protein